jgi:hypothetical protein
MTSCSEKQVVFIFKAEVECKSLPLGKRSNFINGISLH